MSGTHTTPASSLCEHAAQAVSNGGWDDDPAWSVVCECGWETWDHKTEASARERHAEHRAELLLTGRCSCPTCLAKEAA